MDLILCYIFPDTDNVVKLKPEPENDPLHWAWLHSQVDLNPEVNFFYVVETTDVFNDEAEENPELTRMFDSSNVNWTVNQEVNFLFLKSMQNHMNNVLQARGHVLLNDVYDALRMSRTARGAVVGWLNRSDEADNFVDFGIFSDDPAMVAFRNGETNTCLLEFNVDGIILEHIA